MFINAQSGSKSMSRGDQKKVAHQKRMDALREAVNQKIDYHLSKAVIEPADFYHLVTEFFFELMEKEYEPTYEEVLEEIESIEHDFLVFNETQREKANTLLQDLSRIEYSGQDVTQEEAKHILEEFRNLAHEFTRFEEESIDRELRSGMHAARRGDKNAAKQSYQKARDLYEKLGDSEQKRYFTDLQTLYEHIA